MAKQDTLRDVKMDTQIDTTAFHFDARGELLNHNNTAHGWHHTLVSQWSLH
jgi:hypothetical protein